MPSKIQNDENLWFLYTCLQNSDMKAIDFNAVAHATSLKAPAARMRYTRLKRQIETTYPLPLSRSPKRKRTTIPNVSNQLEKVDNSDHILELDNDGDDSSLTSLGTTISGVDIDGEEEEGEDDGEEEENIPLALLRRGFDHAASTGYTQQPIKMQSPTQKPISISSSSPTPSSLPSPSCTNLQQRSYLSPSPQQFRTPIQGMGMYRSPYPQLSKMQMASGLKAPDSNFENMEVWKRRNAQGRLVAPGAWGVEL